MNNKVITSCLALLLIGSIAQAQVSPKLRTGYANPISDSWFEADPTSVEYNGRLYVYGTNDHQQYEHTQKNHYDKIKTLTIMSTDDMVNWTHHGVVPVGDLCKWVNSSWAPSIVSRKEADGKTHFYLYFASNGGATAVLTSTSPVGPWISPLDKDLVTGDIPEVNGCAFDPGAVVDDNGVGWIAVGGGQGRIGRLGKDMISIDSKFIDPHPIHIMEANEMNYIGGKYVYTYCIDWADHNDGTFSGDIPHTCSMGYMTTTTPLDSTSWKFQNAYLNNPGEFETFKWTNNHTHLQKFRGKWYIIYHTEMLMEDMNMYAEGGPEGASNENPMGHFRSIMIDEIQVDEQNAHIYPAKMTKQGPKQIQALNPFIIQQAETVAAAEGIKWEAGDGNGNMIATRGKAFSKHALPEESILLVRDADFSKKAKKFTARLKGQGKLTLHLDSIDAPAIATLSSIADRKDVSAKVNIQGTHDIYFKLTSDLQFDYWQFK